MFKFLCDIWYYLGRYINLIDRCMICKMDGYDRWSVWFISFVRWHFLEYRHKYEKKIHVICILSVSLLFTKWTLKSFSRLWITFYAQLKRDGVSMPHLNENYKQGKVKETYSHKPICIFDADNTVYAKESIY